MIDRIKKYLRVQKDYFAFSQEVLGYKGDEELGFKDLTETHKDLCGFLVRGKKSKIILMPRYSFKSGLITIGWSLWRLVRNPNLRILIYSDSGDKAKGFLAGIKNHIEGKAAGSKFREMYPRWETDAHKGKWNDSEIVVSTRKQAFVEPNVDTGGIETSKIGKHYDIIIFDDIVSDLNTTTKFQMDKVYDCYKKALSLLKPDGEIIIVGTRWHYGDAYGRIIADNREKGNFDEFIKDAEERVEGKLIFEGIGLDEKFLEYQRSEQGSYFYSCLYRNSPCDDETALFKVDNFKYYEPSPNLHKDFFITCTCDPAGEGEDFTAITVVGTDNRKNLYVLDAVNEHLKPHQIINKIINLNYKWSFNKFSIEKNFFQGMLESELKKAVDEERKNQLFKPFSVDTFMSTVARRTHTMILALQPFQERGAIFLPGKSFEQLSKVFSELAFQMIQFTIDGSKSPRDDLLKSLAFHVPIIREGGEKKEEGPPPSSAAAYELEWYNRLTSRRSRIPSKYRKNIKMAFN